MALDERLKRDLERIAHPGDPSGVYEQLIRRRERQRLVRRVQHGALGIAVVAGSIAGVMALGRIIGPADGGSTPLASPRSSGDLAYVTIEEVDRIVIAASDGSSSREVPIPGEGQVGGIAWAPDGTRLAIIVHSFSDGSLLPTGRDLWVAEADGSTPLPIALASDAFTASWHPDSEHLVYVAETRDGHTEVRVAAVDGSDDHVLYEPPLGRSVWSATVSPDGSTIALVQETLPNATDIFLMAAGGENIRRLTTTGTDHSPAWSPDGDEIAFVRTDPGGGADIYLMDADGTDVRRITGRGDDRAYAEPRFSPEGGSIAFIAVGTRGFGPIVETAVDGSTSRLLVDGPVEHFSWQSVRPADTVIPSPDSNPSEDPLGLGFPVCNVSSIDADFVVGGGTEKAYVATRMGDVGGCPQPEEAFNVVALDVDADGLADTSYGPIECELECRTFSAPDIDGDGTAELLVVQSGGSVVGLRLYDIAPDGDTPVIVPVTVAPPGDPEGGFDPGEEVRLLLGGDEWYLYTLRCGDAATPGGPGLIATAAESLPHDSPDAEWHAHQVTFVLREGMLEVTDVRDFTEPMTSEAPSFQSGETLCGSNLGP